MKLSPLKGSMVRGQTGEEALITSRFKACTNTSTHTNYIVPLASNLNTQSDIMKQL